ncbi:MAG TPA: ParB/RepB/Spo0J family partition protein [Firmicutes bacterium]|nr:ParB/RepB/Spo0J family partition protein [Bacillota bacterium]
MENTTENGNDTVVLALEEITPNREQPRKEFDEEKIAELADSIRQHGVLQPLLVRPMVTGGYQIVAGERRFRAARMAGLHEVPVVVRELEDAQVTELALIENLQREDLTPMEEAMGYQSLMEQYRLTQEQVAETVGKSRPAIANALRLLQLPEEIRELLELGKITAGHARALLSFPDEESRMQAAKLAAEQGITVRELEKMAQKAGQPKKEKPRSSQRSTYFDEVELSLHEYLGRRVKVAGSRKKGTLQIEFYGEEDLQALLNSLKLNQ